MYHPARRAVVHRVVVAGLSWLVVAASVDRPACRAGAGGREPLPFVAPKPTAPTLPGWARKARWYYVLISRFRNGDPSNDPHGTLRWTSPWPMTGSRATSGEQFPAGRAQRSDSHERRYGGDLVGLQSQLPYLKSLGINALCVSPIFQAESEHKFFPSDWRHVDDSFGVKNSLAAIPPETLDARTWKLTKSDRMWIEFVEAAHAAGFRVILHAPFSHVGKSFWATQDGEGRAKYADWFEDPQLFDPAPEWLEQYGPSETPLALRRTSDGLAPLVEKHLLNVTTRWMDPNGDGKFTDGIDGWLVDVGRIPHGFLKRWRKQVKGMNPRALIIGDVGLHGSDPVDPKPWLDGDTLDVVVDYETGLAIRRFFSPSKRAHSAGDFFAELASIRKRFPLAARRASLVSLGGQRIGRWLTALVAAGEPTRSGNERGTSGRLSEKAAAWWRLATIFQHFYVGTPMTYYGDEVGMVGGIGVSSRAPMWWPDQLEEGPSEGAYRGDFASLIHWLHTRRSIDAPLRSGEFRTIMVDEARKLLACARTLPGDEVILVINYGDTKQKVMLRAGRPGQMVSLLTPQTGRHGPRRKEPKGTRKPVPLVEPLRMGAARQLVDGEGRIRLWVDTMSLRVVLLRNRHDD